MLRFFKMVAARLGGYFWMPCPICGEHFAGFEIGRGHVTMPDGAQKVCCKKCDFDAGVIETMNKRTRFVSENVARFIGI